MRTLKVIGEDHPMHRTVPVGGKIAEVVYSAVEFDTATGADQVSLVCYRDKSGTTYLSEVDASIVSVRVALDPFKKK